jgi:hypothetical protein
MLGFQFRMARRSVLIAACATAAGTGIAMLHVPAEAVQQQLEQRAGSLAPMTFDGYTFALPRSWPVIDLSGQQRTCVRYNRPAVYLGSPGSNESCPARLAGTTQAMLIQRGPATAKRWASVNPVSRRITVSAPRIKITATYGTDQAQIEQILRSAALPRPVVREPTVKAVPASRARPDLPASATSFHGRGFDSCTAPSAAYMRAWRRHSPYRAIGVYIGGSDRACSQPNLTRAWLRRESRAGWHFFPMYVGPQASYHELSAPVGQGTAAADDAVNQAERLGFAAQTPLYYDMEAYPPGQTGAALRFLSAWTTTVHQLGYASGVYSSSRSGIDNLAKQYFGGVYAMPDVIYDALWNGAANTKDTVLGTVEWSGHRRLHQYQGNSVQAFGGDRIDIDKDYLNVRLGALGGTAQASPSVRQANGTVDVFYRGSNHHLWWIRNRPGHGWAAPVDMGGSLRSAPTAVLPGGGQIDVFYQGSNGKLWQVGYRPGHGWRKAAAAAKMGILGSAPVAVAQPDGIVDVFWKGSADPHLWHGQYKLSKGWSGPQRLGGTLASAPSPVEARPGRVEVFWKGTDQALWHVRSRPGSGWGGPARLGMGPLGGAPQATAAPNGAVRVLWRGSVDAHLWLATASSAGRWTGPRNLGGQLSKAPFPVAPGSGVFRVFWRGQDGKLWQVVSRAKGGWRAPARLPMGKLGSRPFAAIGTGARSVRVFWSRDGRLWSAWLRSGKWTGPVMLGGHVG